MSDAGFIYTYETTGKNVAVAKLKDNCFLATSFSFKEDSDLLNEPVTSFIYTGKNCTVEWCPPFGPININSKASEGDKNTRKDFFLGDAVNGWTQLGVNESRLSDKAINDIEGVFRELARYAE